MIELFGCFSAPWRFRGYQPQKITLGRIWSWLKQFDPDERKLLVQLLSKIIYFPESLVKRILVQQNQALMARLAEGGIAPEKIIYVQIHDAGSSSPVMLNLLRDAMGLEQRGCHFLDGKDTLGLIKKTNDLGEGALIYVDDFVGTGTQFCEARDFAAKHVTGVFSEWLLAPCICEEGFYPLGKRGIEAYTGHVHSKAERPLHANSSELKREAKERLRDLCSKIDPYLAIGFLESAVMVVLYRNAPDNIPIIFRGSENQEPYVGIFPRTTDLRFPD